MQSVEGREAEFARRLSVSDKVSRDRALKKLRTWLHARSQPSAGQWVSVIIMLLLDCIPSQGRPPYDRILCYHL